jgi:hypothetical protein
MIKYRQRNHQRVAQIAGIVQPELPPVPDRFDKQTVISAIGRIQGLCS